MKRFLVIFFFMLLGLGIGYLLFGRFAGEFIPPKVFLATRSYAERILTDAVADISNKRIYILVSAVVGSVVGLFFSFGIMKKRENKNKK